MNTVLGFHNLLMYRTVTEYNVVSDQCLTDSDNRLITDLPNLDQFSPIDLLSRYLEWHL
jgi:hypothetical protein